MGKVLKRNSRFKIIVIAFLLFASFVAMFLVSYENLSGSGFTGALSSSTTTLSVTINSAPVIYSVSTPSSQSITESSTKQINNILFNVTDADGFGTINNNSAQVRINLGGEDDRFNSSCAVGAQFSSTGISFNCSVAIWYFDGAGNWTVNVSINDTSGVYAENRSKSVEIFSTTAMVMSPNALTYPTVEIGNTNTTPNNDPVTINNTGNRNINAGGVTGTGYDLQGLTTTTDFIQAANFSIAAVNGTSTCTGVSCLECNGTMMANNTAQVLTVANISAGNNSLNTLNGSSGQEQLFFCLRVVPTGISRQVYDTSGAYTSPWTIAVS